MTAMTPRAHKSTPVFTRATLPDGLRRNHSLKAGTWGRLNLLAGSLRYVIAATGEETILKPGDGLTIPPQQLHHVEPLGEIEMRIDFYDCCPD